MKQMLYVVVGSLLLLNCAQSEISAKQSVNKKAQIELIDKHFFKGEEAPFSFAINVGPGSVNNCYSEKDRTLIPGYPMNRVLGELPFQPVDRDSQEGTTCHFEFVRNPSISGLNLTKLKRFKYESCSIYFADYPKITGGYIALNTADNDADAPNPRPSPASDCYFRLAMTLQGFDRVLFMTKSDLFDDISKVAPFETLYSSNARNVPILAGYMAFRCPQIRYHYYSDNLRTKLIECITEIYSKSE